MSGLASIKPWTPKLLTYSFCDNHKLMSKLLHSENEPKVIGRAKLEKKLINVNMNSWSLVTPRWPWNGHLRLLPLLCYWSIWQPWMLTRFIRISTVCVKPLPVLYGVLAFIALLRRLMLAIAGNFHIFIRSSKYESFHTFPVYSLCFIQ